MKRKKIGMLIGILAVAVAGLCAAAWWLLGSRSETPVLKPQEEKTADLTAEAWTVADYEAYCAEHPEQTVRWSVPIAGTVVPSDATEAALPDFTEADLAMLSYLPSLARLDLTGCTEPSVLEAALALEDVETVYEVQIGAERLPYHTETLVFSGDLSELSAAKLLFSLKTIDLSGRSLSVGELSAVQADFPSCTVLWQAELYGATVRHDTETADASAVSDAQLSEFAAELRSYLPFCTQLSAVSLGTELRPLETVLAAKEQLAPLAVSFVTELYGVAVDSNATSFSLAGIRLSDTEALERLVTELPHLERVDMVGCGLDDEAMMALNDRHTGRTRFIWEFSLGFWGRVRTDVVIYSTHSNKTPEQNRHRLTVEDLKPFSYCLDLKALDLGHQNINSLEWVRPLKELEVLIVADSRIEDLSPLQELTKLKYLEVFMNDVTDPSPLTTLTELVDLNLAFNELSDVSCLKSMTSLERLWISLNDLEEGQAEALREALPNCEINDTARASTEEGWREHVRYQWIRTLFTKYVWVEMPTE